MVVGAGHTVVLTKTGRVFTFGSNFSGQLGRGPLGTTGVAEVVLPELAATAAAGEGQAVCA